MRITARIAAGGHRSLTRIPFAAELMEDCLGMDGKLDRVKAQLAFAGSSGIDGWQPFTLASRDDERVYYAAMTYLELLHNAFAEVVADKRADVAEGATCRQDERLVARMDKGKFVYVRQDIRRTRDGVTVKVEVSNPHEIVGESELEARQYAGTCVQLWLRIMEQVKWILLDPSTDAEFVATAKRRNADAEDRRTYGECPNRRGDLCSPSKFDCKFYRDGACRFGINNNTTTKV